MAAPGSAAWFKARGIEQAERPTETLEETRRRLDPEYFERREAARALGGTLNTPVAVGYGEADSAARDERNRRRSGDLHSMYIYLSRDVGWYDVFSGQVEQRDYWKILWRPGEKRYALYLKQSYGRR